MNTISKVYRVTREGSRSVSAEQRLRELGIKLPAPPEPFGTYMEEVQTGNLLFLSGMLHREAACLRSAKRKQGFLLHPLLPSNRMSKAGQAPPTVPFIRWFLFSGSASLPLRSC